MSINLSTVRSPLCTCEIKGQLGNQLFEISATLAYAWDYGLEPLFPGLNSGDLHLSYNRDKIFFRLNTCALPRGPQFRFHESGWGQDNPEKPPYHLGHYLHGFFQSLIYSIIIEISFWKFSPFSMA